MAEIKLKCKVSVSSGNISCQTFYQIRKKFKYKSGYLDNIP